MTKTKEHRNFGALIALGLTIAWFITILDLIAVVWLSSNDKKPTLVIYYSEENHKNDTLKNILIIILSLSVELALCCLGEIWIWILTFRQWYITKRNKRNTYFDLEEAGREEVVNEENNKSFFEYSRSNKDKYWWGLLLLFIPPIWCLVSHIGFVIIALSSFVRHSLSFMLFYAVGVTVMFLVMRQSYKLIVDKYYDYLKTTRPRIVDKYHEYLNTTTRRKNQRDDGISVWVIQLVRVVGVLQVVFFLYLIFGLWLLPVTELVEESPVHLYDSLQLIVVVLAILVSYELISVRNKQKCKIKLSDDETQAQEPAEEATTQNTT